jgi:hypothetical protein
MMDDTLMPLLAIACLLLVCYILLSIRAIAEARRRQRH